MEGQRKQNFITALLDVVKDVKLCWMLIVMFKKWDNRKRKIENSCLGR
jgi:hypothetical protein